MARHVASMSNQGARLIEDCMFNEAIQVLSQALPLIRQSVRSNKTCRHHEDDALPSSQLTSSNDDEQRGLSSTFGFSSSQAASTADKEDDMMDTSNHHQYHSNKSSSASCSSYSQDENDDGLFIDCVFSKPIKLEQIPKYGFSPYDYSKLSAVLIFNLALAHHLYAIQHQQLGQTNCPHLQRALGLYGAAMKLSKRECNPLYLLAIQNNITRVYVAMFDERNATACAEALLSSIMVIADCEQQQRMAGIVSQDDEALLTQFFGSVQSLFLRDPCTASAA